MYFYSFGMHPHSGQQVPFPQGVSYCTVLGHTGCLGSGSSLKLSQCGLLEGLPACVPQVKLNGLPPGQSDQSREAESFDAVNHKYPGTGVPLFTPFCNLGSRHAFTPLLPPPFGIMSKTLSYRRSSPARCSFREFSTRRSLHAQRRYAPHPTAVPDSPGVQDLTRTPTDASGLSDVDCGRRWRPGLCVSAS